MQAFLIRPFVLCVVWIGACVPVMRAQDPRGAQQPAGNSGSPALDRSSTPSTFYQTGKFDAAVEEYSALLTRGSQPVLAYAGLARVYLKQRKPAEAYTAAA